MSHAVRFPIIVIILGLPAFAGSTCGIRNFDQVDVRVYRGGQPTSEGFQCLVGLGVRTIIDLREGGRRAQAEERLVNGAGMAYLNVPMTGLAPPTGAQIVRILATLEDNAAGQVFVHCWRGADRTGVVIAAYHIDHDNWNNSRALKDAKAHKMGSFQFPREQYIKTFRPAKQHTNVGSLSGDSAAADRVASSPAPPKAGQ